MLLSFKKQKQPPEFQVCAMQLNRFGLYLNIPTVKHFTFIFHTVSYKCDSSNHRLKNRNDGSINDTFCFPFARISYRSRLLI